MNELCAEWRRKNPDKFLECKRNWYKKNPHKYKEYTSRRRALRNISSKIIQSVYENNIKFYGTLTCVLCRLPIAFGLDSLEHLNPVSRGGTNDITNLAVSHLVCNSRKLNKTFDEFNRLYGL